MDDGFAAILRGIKNCKLGASLVNLMYSNNEIGEESVKEICDLLDMSFGLGKGRCL